MSRRYVLLFSIWPRRLNRICFGEARDILLPANRSLILHEMRGLMTILFPKEVFIGTTSGET